MGRLSQHSAARSSGTPSRQPLHGDKAGVGERSELGVSRHHDTTVVLSGDNGEGVGVGDREAGPDMSCRQHCRP
jgi:hypothetical protein